MSELSFGAAGIGNLYSAVTEEAARAAVDTAWEQGIRYFDTTHRRRWDFSASGIARSLADSLEAYPALERLRAEGVVGAIGVGMNQPASLARFVRETDVDVVLLAGRYTLLDQRGLEELLPASADRGVSVVAGGVFNSGLLADPRSDATFDYAKVSPEVLARAVRMRDVCQQHGVPLRAAALRFPFGHPAVAGVLLGCRSAAEVHDAVTMARATVPSVLWDDLRAAGLLPPDVPVPVSDPATW